MVSRVLDGWIVQAGFESSRHVGLDSQSNGPDAIGSHSTRDQIDHAGQTCFYNIGDEAGIVQDLAFQNSFSQDSFFQESVFFRIRFSGFGFSGFGRRRAWGHGGGAQ